MFTYVTIYGNVYITGLIFFISMSLFFKLVLYILLREVHSRGFYCFWNYPYCLGMLDVKRILIEKAAISGSEFCDKGQFFHYSHGPEYKFLYVDVRTNGQVNGSAVWIETGILAEAYVIVGNDAFSLKPCLLKPS